MVKVDELVIKQFKLAAQGIPTKEIADMVCVTPNSVNENINKLKNPESIYYNMDLYNKIIFLRDMDKYCVDKDYIENIGQLIEQGYTFIEIAIILDETYENIKNYLKKMTLKNYSVYDKERYDRLILLEKSSSLLPKKVLWQRLAILEKKGYSFKGVLGHSLIKSYYKNKRIKEMLMTYIDFRGSMSLESLEDRFKINKIEIGHILNDKELICELIGKQKYLQFAEIRLQHRQESHQNNIKVNNSFFERKISKENANIISNIFNNYEFYLKFICTFRISLNDFMEILGYNGDVKYFKDKLYEVMMKDFNCLKAISYNFLIANNDSRKVLELKNYLKLLKRAYLNQDMGKVDRYLSMVDDRDYFQIVNSQIPWNNLTKKQKLIVIKFRIKYAISNEYLPYEVADLEKESPTNYKKQLDDVRTYNLSFRRYLKKERG